MWMGSFIQRGPCTVNLTLPPLKKKKLPEEVMEYLQVNIDVRVISKTGKIYKIYYLLKRAVHVSLK